MSKSEFVFSSFIKEHDDYDIAVPLEDYKSGKSQPLVDGNGRELIKEYVQNGVLITAWMGFIQAIDTNDSISSDGFLTDGIYIWRSYLPYYLDNHPNFRIESEFAEHIAAQKNSKYTVDEQALTRAEKAIVKLVNRNKID